MKTVCIKHGSNPAIGAETVTFTEDGEKIEGITSIQIDISVNRRTTATIKLSAKFDELNARLLFDEETLQRSADALGYELVKS